MKSATRCLLLSLCLSFALASAQSPPAFPEKADSIASHVAPSSPQLRSRAWVKAMEAPVALGLLSLFSITNNNLLDERHIRTRRNHSMPDFRTHADDYLQYAPGVAMFALDAFGIKAQHDFANRTAMLIKTEALVGVLCYSLKRITAVPRPDTGAPTSFPSGHTAQAFAVATLMSKEYGNRNPWYSVGAYTLASGIGIMRVMNNRHWVSDVLAGAGVGILSANIVYLTHQYRWGKKRSHRTIIPTVNQGNYGLVYIYRL